MLWTKEEKLNLCILLRNNQLDEFEKEWLGCPPKILLAGNQAFVCMVL